MPRIPDADKASLEDFSWLDVRQYDPLREGDLQKWAQLISDRVTLTAWLDLAEKKPENSYLVQKAVTQFNCLQKTPLKSLVGATMLPDHPVNQQAIRLLTTGQVVDLHNRVTDRFGEPISGLADSVDDVLIEREKKHDEDHAYLTRYAHLKIDLHATEKQLENTFAVVLNALKAHRQTVIPRSKHSVPSIPRSAREYMAPYFDMCFWARIIDKKIDQKTFVAKLTRPTPGIDPTSDSAHKPSDSIMNELRRDLPRIFSVEFANVLRNAVAIST